MNYELDGNFLLDVLCLSILIWRFIHGDIYEVGAMLRLGLIIGFSWVVANDIDEIWAVGLLGGTHLEWTFFRQGTLKVAVLTGLVLDLWRSYSGRKYLERIEKIKKFALGHK